MFLVVGLQICAAQLYCGCYGSKLWSSWFHSKHVSNWAIFPASYTRTQIIYNHILLPLWTRTSPLLYSPRKVGIGMAKIHLELGVDLESHAMQSGSTEAFTWITVTTRCAWLSGLSSHCLIYLCHVIMAWARGLDPTAMSHSGQPRDYVTTRGQASFERCLVCFLHLSII